MKHTWLKLLAVLLAFGLLAAACGDDDDDTATEEPADDTAEEPAEEPADDTAEEPADDTAEEPADDTGGEMDLSGETVSILGPEIDAEAEGFLAGFGPLEDATGVSIDYEGSRDATTLMNLAIESGEPPDIGIVPQPGRVLQYAESGDIVPIPQDMLDGVGADYNPFWFELSTSDGQAYGMPAKGDVKSLVWYNPSVFDANGYTIPETWDELMALADQMKADGITPWCITIGSGDATGWPFTDWMEDVMLRLKGPDVYDQWVNHEIPFNDPAVAEVTQFVADIWFEEGNVLGGRDIIASTDFSENAAPILNGDCGLHRQANFFAAQFVDAGGTLGEDYDVFYLPTITDDFGTVVLGAGVLAVAFNDNPATMAALEALGSAEFANARILADKGGYLSPNTAHDTSLYSSDLDRKLAEILVSADPFRFDASDLMPGEVGGGEWWRSGTDYVSGAITLEEFLDNTEEAWPA